MSRPSLLAKCLCLMLALTTGSAKAQTDPLALVDSLASKLFADSASRQLLRPDASGKWGIERQARSLQEKAIAGMVRASVYQRRMQLDSAVAVLNGLLGLLADTADGPTQACVHFMLGRAELLRNNITGAILQLEQALRITGKEPYPRLNAQLERFIGACYAEIQDYPLARSHLLAALAFPMDAASRFNILGTIVETDIAMGDHDQAERHLDMLESMEDSVGVLRHLVDLERGEWQVALGHYEESIGYFRKALEGYTAHHDVVFQAWTLSRLSRACRMAGHADLAMEYALEGLRLSERHTLRKELQDNEHELYQAYAAAGRKAAAFDHLQRYLALRDSATGSRATGAVTSAMLRTQMERQARADSLLRAERDLREADAQKAAMDRERTKRNIAMVIGVLFAGFVVVVFRQRNKMRKERDRSEELLLNILPEEVAAELKEKGQADAQLIDHATVLFTDFKGFTTMSERVSPRQLVHDLHECFSAFDAICQKHGIEKIKTIGDAYMAAGGLPTPNSTHAVDVVSAALEMRDFIAWGRDRKIAAGLPYFEVRIGIHTGPVVAGIVGVRKFQYDIWGDTVNTANRMESSGAVGEVNISEATCKLLRDVSISELPAASVRMPWSAPAPDHVPSVGGPAFNFTPRGKVKVRGKGEMEMFFVRRGTEEGTEENFVRHSSDMAGEGVVHQQ